MWSFGCVYAQMLLGQALFEAPDAMKQIKEIFKVLGTPTTEDLTAMNEKFKNFKYTQFSAVEWNKIFSKSMPNEAFSILQSLLVYNPTKRIKSINLLSFKFFDELFNDNITLINGNNLPNDLFKFTKNGNYYSNIIKG